MTAELILTERDGPIATVILNRPEKVNALTKPMWQRLGEMSEGRCSRPPATKGASRFNWS
jgi:enoyl-CoA hydratase/carnithine racemase